MKTLVSNKCPVKNILLRKIQHVLFILHTTRVKNIILSSQKSVPSLNMIQWWVMEVIPPMTITSRV